MDLVETLRNIRSAAPYRPSPHTCRRLRAATSIATQSCTPSSHSRKRGAALCTLVPAIMGAARVQAEIPVKVRVEEFTSHRIRPVHRPRQTMSRSIRAEVLEWARKHGLHSFTELALISRSLRISSSGPSIVDCCISNPTSTSQDFKPTLWAYFPNRHLASLIGFEIADQLPQCRKSGAPLGGAPEIFLQKSAKVALRIVRSEAMHQILEPQIRPQGIIFSLPLHKGTELFDWDWKAAERESLCAIDLNPSYATVRTGAS